MVKIKELFQRRNQFTSAEIEEVSSFIFEAFTFNKENWHQSVETRIAMLNGFIEVMRQFLFSDIIHSDDQRVAVVEILDKLISQKELFELSLAEEGVVKDLVATAGGVDKKTAAVIGI